MAKPTEWKDVAEQLKTAIKPTPYAVFEMVSKDDMQGESTGVTVTTATSEFEITYVPSREYFRLLLNDGYVYSIAHKNRKDDDMSWSFDYAKTIDEVIEYITGY